LGDITRVAGLSDAAVSGRRGKKEYTIAGRLVVVLFLVNSSCLLECMIAVAGMYSSELVVSNVCEK
jgi:hypothetical protein